jgi:dUTP pyrophosphatase
MRVEIINKSDFELPKYQTIGSAGMDLRANIDKDYLFLLPRKQYLIPTGIHIKLPDPVYDYHSGEGYLYEAQIRPRSGLAAKHGVTVVNTPGTIDADYTGEIKVILINLTDEPYKINKGDRIAQMVINRVEKISWLEVDELAETERGGEGFGHTGYK